MPDKSSNQTMYTLQDLADKTGIGLQTWRKYAARGDLKASKVGRSYLVWPHNFEEFIKSREVNPIDRKTKPKADR